VASLWNNRSEATRGERPSTPERVAKTWDHPKFDLATDSRLVFAPDGTLIGYAHIRDVKDPPVDVFAGYSVHPDYEESDWLWDDLFEWMDAEARRVIPRAPNDARIALVAGASDEDTIEQRELERHGFEHSRTFFRMRTVFDGAPTRAMPPDGVAIRTFKPGEDDEALVRVHREAFADHYGHLEQPFETDLAEWRRLMTEDDFDPKLWLLACDADGTIAGFCIAYAEAPGDPEVGLVDELSVRPAWRRRGIARTLLLQAFGALRRKGVTGAVLTVDSENRTGATALYESVGMQPVRINHTYVKELRPGINLVAG
jgi:mycothiol synthase